jgi:hypothetical protein
MTSATNDPNDDPNDEVDDPIDEVDLDEGRLDAELDAGGGDLGVSLRALLEPPTGIERRTADTVEETLRGRSAVSLGMDLLTLGWRTVATILTDDPPPADGVPEGNDHDE